MDKKSSTRNNYLDWLRVLAILFVFVYHSTRFFNLDDWEVKNLVRYQWLDIWNLFSWNMGMPLIFVISGASLFYAIGRGSAGKFIKDKVLRLLVPYLVASFTHATLQVYLNWITHGRFSGSYFQFLPKYFSEVFTSTGPFFILGLWQMHLWYLLWLFLFSLLLYPLLRWLKGSGQRALAVIGGFFARPTAVYLLALPTVLLIALPNPDSPVISIKAGGWSQVIYLWLMFCGFLLVSNPRLEASIRRLRWISLGVAVAIMLFIVYILLNYGVPVFGQPLYTIGFGLLGFSSWCWILTCLGFAMVRLDFRLPVVDYANLAVLPFYILHQSVLIVVGYFIIQLPIPDLLKWAIILVASFAIIMTFYEFLIRRVNLLRIMFGMKAVPRLTTVPVSENQVAAR